MDVNTIIGIISTSIVVIILTSLLIWSINSINKLSKSQKTLNDIVKERKLKRKNNGRSRH